MRLILFELAVLLCYEKTSFDIKLFAENNINFWNGNYCVVLKINDKK